MKEELAIRLEAWFDGELPAREAAEIEALLEADAQARAYLEELKQTRKALASVPVSDADPEFAWSTVEERLDQPARADIRKIVSIPRMVTSIAAIMVIGVGLWVPMRKMGTQTETLAAESVVQMVETDIENATPIVYLDQPSGWTVVWVMEAEES